METQATAPVVAPPAPAPTPKVSVPADGADGLGPSDAQLIAAYEAAHPAAPAPAPAAAPPPAPAAPPPATTVATPGDIAAQAAQEALAGPADLDARIAKYVAESNRGIQAQLEHKNAAAAEKARADGLAAELAALRAGLKDDPLAVVAKEGWDFEALARKAVGAGTPESVEIRRIREEVAALKAEREASSKAAAEERAAREQAALRDRWRATVIPELKAREAEFRHVLAIMEPEELTDAVATVVQRVYDGSNGQRILTVGEAAALLEQQAQSRLQRIGPLVQSAPPPAAAPKPAPTGLTNALTQTTPPDDDPEDISDAALQARAIAFARSRGYTK